MHIWVNWGTSWQNQQMICAPSEDSEQPGYLSSLIRVLAVSMKRPWVLGYPSSWHRKRLSDCVDAEADLYLCWVHMSFCWFCRAVAHFSFLLLLAGSASWVHWRRERFTLDRLYVDYSWLSDREKFPEQATGHPGWFLHVLSARYNHKQTMSHLMRKGTLALCNLRSFKCRCAAIQQCEISIYSERKSYV